MCSTANEVVSTLGTVGRLVNSVTMKKFFVLLCIVRSKIYKTLDKSYEANQLRVFFSMYEKVGRKETSGIVQWNLFNRVIYTGV